MRFLCKANWRLKSRAEFTGYTYARKKRTIFESKPTQNPEAYLFYLRARERETGYAKGDADIVAADQLYAQAIALDPKFALARARRSILNSTGYTPPMLRTRIRNRN